MIRIFDLVISFVFIILLSPLLLVISFLIWITSPGGIFYNQVRIGKNKVPFVLYKFRSMYIGSDKLGLLTIGSNDSRITKIGALLRVTKLDELPQFINVLKGEMSIVGPRPEIEKYTSLYTFDQARVLEILPGITDLASIKFRNENELLALQTFPEDYYIKEIIPQKIKLNLKYIENQNVFNYFKIIYLTFINIITK
jgi:lipopolysaccharide/colanic/teichoic acid biosynthesis glycosyltransferase